MPFPQERPLRQMSDKVKQVTTDLMPETMLHVLWKSITGDKKGEVRGHGSEANRPTVERPAVPQRVNEGGR